MNAQQNFEITELHRRLANLIRLGKVIESDPAPPIPKVRVKIGRLITAWLPVMTQRAGMSRMGWALEVDEQVLVLAPSGELGQGVVLGSLNQTAFPTPTDNPSHHRAVYPDGAMMTYDSKAHHLTAHLPQNGQVSLEAPGGVMVMGDVWVTGDITASGDVSDQTRSMAEDREIYNDHLHEGVAAGDKKTLPPVQQQ